MHLACGHCKAPSLRVRVEASATTESDLHSPLPRFPQQHNNNTTTSKRYIECIRTEQKEGAEPGIEPGTSPILRESVKLPGMYPKGELYH